MKIVVAPNAFKGSMTASQAARAMAAGFSKVLPSAAIVEIPISDGGDGFLEVVGGALGVERYELSVQGPRGGLIEASFGYLPAAGLAVVESALASGIALLGPERRDPMKAGTFGTGELIRGALDVGARRIVVGVGGSATNDGGIGAAMALGARFLDQGGRLLDPTAGSLRRIERIDLSDLDSRLSETPIEVFCDVDNPLVGSSGATRVFGRQKGVLADQIEELEEGLGNFAAIVEARVGLDLRDIPGSGAAGGLAAGLHGILGAKLRKGAESILDLLGFDSQLDKANLVVTGEGRLDAQTRAGKAPAEVARLAASRGIPCIAIAGSLADDRRSLASLGFSSSFALCADPASLSEAMTNPEALLERVSEDALGSLISGGFFDRV